MEVTVISIYCLRFTSLSVSLSLAQTIEVEKRQWEPQAEDIQTAAGWHGADHNKCQSNSIQVHKKVALHK